MDVIVIGAGYWGQNYIRELGGNLVGVIESDVNRANYIAKTYNVNVFPPEDLDDISGYDGAIIATPPMNHMFYASKLLKQGKYVLVEKPMADSMLQAFAVKNVADRLMISNVYRYHPSIQALRQRIQDGLQIDHAYSRRTNDGPVRPWKNAAWDLAWHDIAIFNYLFNGKPIHVTSFGTRSYAVFRLEYVVREAIIYVSWVGSPKIRRLELVPVEGERIIFDDVATVLEISPLRLMLDQFLEGKWHEACGYDAALDVITVLEATFLPQV